MVFAPERVTIALVLASKQFAAAVVAVGTADGRGVVYEAVLGEIFGQRARVAAVGVGTGVLAWSFGYPVCSLSCWRRRGA